MKVKTCWLKLHFVIPIFDTGSAAKITCQLSYLVNFQSMITLQEKSKNILNNKMNDVVTHHNSYLWIYLFCINRCSSVKYCIPVRYFSWLKVEFIPLIFSTYWGLNFVSFHISIYLGRLFLRTRVSCLWLLNQVITLGKFLESYLLQFLFQVIVRKLYWYTLIWCSTDAY